MNLIQVLLFLGGVIIYRLLLDQKGKIWVILIACIFGIFWLQPASIIRNSDYWFPFLSISLIIITWLVITPKKNINTKENLISFLIILAISIFIPFSRYLPIEINVTATLPPQPLSVVIAVFILFIGSVLFYFLKQKNNVYLVHIILLFIITFFILLKSPFLNSKINILLKIISGQSIGTVQGTGSDLRWLGFSYIAFRLIHTLRDFQSKRYQATGLCNYFDYVIFFPALVAGPIDRIEHFENEIKKETNKTQDFIVGGKRLIFGLTKKFVIADMLALISLNSDNATLVKSTFWLWVMLIAYAWMIYFDFSGYTDIALGMSACLGIALPENFDQPYSAKNLTIFWNKWHMSLTQWFRSYFFNPLTRFLRSKEKPISPTLIIALTQISTMSLIGLWHGISWNYLYWGLWHGIGLFIHNRWAFFMQKFTKGIQLNNSLKKVISVFSVVFTFAFIALGWIWFIIPDLHTSIMTFMRLFGSH